MQATSWQPAVLPFTVVDEESPAPDDLPTAISAESLKIGELGSGEPEIRYVVAMVGYGAIFITPNSRGWRKPIFENDIRFGALRVVV
ncbi:hypothetical protein ACFX2I_025468 [Malus domestica]